MAVSPNRKIKKQIEKRKARVKLLRQKIKELLRMMKKDKLIK